MTQFQSSAMGVLNDPVLNPLGLTFYIPDVSPGSHNNAMIYKEWMWSFLYCKQDNWSSWEINNLSNATQENGVFHADFMSPRPKLLPFLSAALKSYLKILVLTLTWSHGHLQRRRSQRGKRRRKRGRWLPHTSEDPWGLPWLLLFTRK